MHRFFLPPDGCQGGTVTLEERDSHHAVRVLRIGPGEGIEVLDGAGRVLACRVIEAGKRAVLASVERVRTVSRPPEVWLAPALIKGRAMDFLVQKATELGVTAVQPLVTERTIVAVQEDTAEDKVAQWRLTAIEACKQCGNPWLPEFRVPQPIRRWLDQCPPGRLLVASLDPAARLPGEVLRGSAPAPGPITLVLGPEGDLTADELDQLARAGALPITLGPLVLRAETAAIAALAVLQHELRLAAGACVSRGA